MGKVVYMALQKEIMMKTFNFNAPCEIGDAVYYIETKFSEGNISHTICSGTVEAFVMKKDKISVRLPGYGECPYRCIPINCVSPHKFIAEKKIDELDNIDRILGLNVYTGILYAFKIEPLISNQQFDKRITVKLSLCLGDPVVCPEYSDSIKYITVFKDRIYYHSDYGCEQVDHL